MTHSTPEKRRAYQMAYHEKNRERRKVIRFKYDRKRRALKYGTTAEEVEAATLRQGGMCAICGLAPSGKTRLDRSLVVDHCHQTGRFRAMLCSSCNLGIGRLKDNPALCRAAALYLEQHGG